MKLLLDTHTLIWAVDAPSKLGPQAVTALQDPANDLLLSAATIWEIAIKVGLGKLSLSMPYRQVDEPSNNRSGNDHSANHRGIRRRAGAGKGVGSLFLNDYFGHAVQGKFDSWIAR